MQHSVVRRLTARRRLTAFVFTAACLYGQTAFAAGPFTPLAGEWSGRGRIYLSDGHEEGVRCRARNNVGANGNQMQQSLRCASESYNFELRSDVEQRNGVIQGNWSESTRSIGGEVSGRVRGGTIEVVVRSSSFSATLTLQAHGNRQSVTIRPSDRSQFNSASITLARGG